MGVVVGPALYGFLLATYRTAVYMRLRTIEKEAQRAAAAKISPSEPDVSENDLILQRHIKNDVQPLVDLVDKTTPSRGLPCRAFQPFGPLIARSSSFIDRELIGY
jgi:hypothetical protein